MIQRGGEVVIRMLANVKQVTIGPLIKRTIAQGVLVSTDEYDISSRLVEWGYGHETVCHAAGEYARDDDGDGFREVPVNTLEGFWSLLRSRAKRHLSSILRLIQCSPGFASAGKTATSAITTDARETLSCDRVDK